VLLYLRQLLLLDEPYALGRQPAFWVSTGFLIFSVGNTLVEGVANYLINSSGSFFVKIYYIYSILNYVLFIFLSLALISKKTAT
jgi:hypothetical protein